MITAPTNNNIALVAASGTRTGAMSSAAGRIRPAAARSSRPPRALRAPGAEVFDPSRGGAHAGHLLLGDEQLGAAEQEDNGQQSGNDPQSEVQCEVDEDSLAACQATLGPRGRLRRGSSRSVQTALPSGRVSPTGVERASDLLWVLPLLACGYSPNTLPFPLVREF